MQRDEKNNNNANKLSQKQYSPADIKKIKTLQDLRKRYISFKHTQGESAKALGEARAINIKKKSAENLKKIKDRLRKGAFLPEQDAAVLAQEKKANDILTPKEIPLFKTLLNKRYILQHTTSASSLEKIQASQTMLDPKELERRGIGSKQATPDYCGVEQNIFFGIGSEHSSLPKFVREPTNFETGKPEDYATLQIDYNQLMAADSHVAESIWSSGHFTHFLSSGVTSKVASMGIPLFSVFALLMSNPMEPVTLGDTTFAWRYLNKSPEQKALDELTIANPMFRTQNKVLLFHRNVSDNNDNDEDESNTVVELPLDIDDEIAAGGDIVPFLAYSFIERLRMLGGSMREYLLTHPDDERVIDNVLEKFFRVDEFELHIPSKLSLSPTFTKIITPQIRKAMTEAVRNASAAGDIKTLEKLFSQGYPLDGYMYEDPYHFDNTPATELPLVAAIKAGNLDSIRWLIGKGAHRSAFSKAGDSRPREVDEDDKYDILITTALEAGNVEIFDYLIQQGLDINKKYNEHVQYKQQMKAAKKEAAEGMPSLKKKAKKYDSDDSDKYFLAALRAVSKNGKMDMLDAMLRHSDYARSPKVQKQRLVYDAAAMGDVRVFQYMLAKFGSEEECNYTDLFVKAAVNNNLVLMESLFSQANFNHDVPKTKEGLRALRSKKADRYFDGERYSDIDVLDLHDMAVELLNKGRFEGAEWLLKKSFPVTPGEIGEIVLQKNLFNDGEDTLEARIKWLVANVKADPCQPIKEYEFAGDDKRTTLISFVIKQAKNDLAKWLMATYKIDPSTILFNNKSLLMEAVENDNVEFADYLLSQGAKVPQDADMIRHIIKEKQVKTLQWLLAHGVSIDDEEIVIAAMTEGSPEIMDILAAGKVSFPAAEKANELFGKAIDQNNKGMLDWLEKHYTFNASQFQDKLVNLFDPENSTPIFMLEELIQWLVARGLKLDSPDSKGNTSLRKLLSSLGFFNSNHHGRLQFLKSRGIDVDSALKEWGGLDALMRAISTDCSLAGSLLGRDNTLSLIQMGVPLNQVFTRDNPAAPCAPMTPLEYASSMGGKAKVVRQLLSAGARADFIHNENATALHLACGQSLGRNHRFRFMHTGIANTEVIKLLLAANVPVNIGKESPLAVLCRQKEIPVAALEALLQAGANPNYGAPKSPLYFALVAPEKLDAEVIQKLLQAGANPDQKIPRKNQTIRALVAQDYPELCELFAKYPPVAAAPAMLAQRDSAMRIFLTAAPKDAKCAEAGTGDIDYANTLVNAIRATGVNIVNATGCGDETALMQLIKSQTMPGEQPVLHVLVNAPYTGFMLTPKALDTFKQQGIKIVVTAVEFAKHAARKNSESLLEDTFAFLAAADSVIFLDEEDKKSALRYARTANRELPASQVIAVPSTVPVTNKPMSCRGNDILCFGMLRHGKGMAHIIKLARLIKDSKDASIQFKKILVTGKIGKIQEDKTDATLYKLMKEIYPSKVDEMNGKTPMELANLLNKWKDDESIQPALPVELHLNVEEKQLKKIFDRCAYSYLPAYRGATLRNSSISSSIANSFITYAHQGMITPPCLLPGGEHEKAVVLVNYDETKDFYEYAAETVLKDIAGREADPELNAATIQAAEKLVDELLSVDVIACQHVNVYSALPVHNNVLAKASDARLLASSARLFVTPVPDTTADVESVTSLRIGKK